MKLNLFLGAMILAPILIFFYSCKPEPTPTPTPPKEPIDTVFNDTTFIFEDTLEAEDFEPCTPACFMGSCFDIQKDWFFQLDSCRVKYFPRPGSFGYDFIDDISQTLPGSFNPENENEFVYIKNTFGAAGSNSGINIINLCSGYRRNLGINKLTTGPHWGKNGWLVFAVINDGIWKIKSNGDSLIALPSISAIRANDLHAYWNPDGTKLLYLSREKGLVITTPNGDSLQAFPGFYSGFWSVDGSKIITAQKNDHTIGYIDLLTNQFTPVITDLSYSYHYSCGPDSAHILWSDGATQESAGIYITNIHTKETQLFHDSFVNRAYQFFMPSPDGSKVVAALLMRKYVKANTLLLDRFAAFISADGSCEIIGEFDR